MIGLALSLNRCINASDEARALAAIRRNGGTVLLAGLARNYFDSAGTTPAQVDQPVGLVLDGAGTVGPELFNVTLNFSDAAWTKTAAVISTGANTFATNGFGGCHAYVTAQGAKTYAVRVVGTTTVSTTFRNAAGASGAFTVPAGAFDTGSNSQILLENGSLYIQLASAGTINITSISVKELTGNHATQATTGSKPTLRRGLVNQLLWSGDFTNAAWTKTGASVATGQPDPSGGTSGLKLVESAASTQHYFLQNAISGSGAASAAYIVKASGRTKVRIRSEGPQTFGLATNFNLSTVSIQSGSGSIADLGNGFYLCVANSTGNGNGASGYHLIQPTDDSWNETYLGDGVSGILIYRAALYQGTVTAQQIIAAGGIPLTTTAPASSALGSYWWQYDPAAPGDFLQTAITTGNEGWVCAGVTFGGALGNKETVFSSGAGSATMKGVWLTRIEGVTNQLRMGVGNGTELTMPAHVGVELLNVKRVVEGGWNATTVFVGVDGAITSLARTGDAGPSPSPLDIGRYISGAHYMAGAMPVQVICPTLPPAADRALIRAWVAKQQGQTL